MERNIAALMSRALNKMNLKLLELLRDHGINNQHFRIIQVLYDDDGVSVGEISRRLVITHPVVSRILIQMEERSLIRRVPAKKDLRFRMINLTEQGRSMYEDVWPAAREILSDSVRFLPDEEQQELIRLLAKLDRAISLPPLDARG